MSVAVQGDGVESARGSLCISIDRMNDRRKEGGRSFVEGGFSTDGVEATR